MIFSEIGPSYKDSRGNYSVFANPWRVNRPVLYGVPVRATFGERKIDNGGGGACEDITNELNRNVLVGTNICPCEDIRNELNRNVLASSTFALARTLLTMIHAINRNVLTSSRSRSRGRSRGRGRSRSRSRIRNSELNCVLKH